MFDSSTSSPISAGRSKNRYLLIAASIAEILPFSTEKLRSVSPGFQHDGFGAPRRMVSFARPSASRANSHPRRLAFQLGWARRCEHSRRTKRTEPRGSCPESDSSCARPAESGDSSASAPRIAAARIKPTLDQAFTIPPPDAYRPTRATSCRSIHGVGLPGPARLAPCSSSRMDRQPRCTARPVRRGRWPCRAESASNLL